MPKIVDTEALKLKIIKNAFNAFVEKGYYKSSMADISRSCNMNRTTIYYYFKNKDEVFEQTVYYVIETIEKDINEISKNDQMTLKNKIKYLNNKWEKEFNNNNIILILLEMWLAIKREESEMFIRIQKRVKEMNQSINQLVLEKTKYKINSKKERLEFTQCSIIMCILHQICMENNFISDHLISIITSI